MPVGHFAEQGVDQVSGRMLEWSCYTPWVNFTGQPAVALPSHLDDDGLPHRVQLVGRPRHDVGLVALAAQLEATAFSDLTHPAAWYQ